MSEIAVYLEAIREAYPDLVIEKAHAGHGDGQFNDILIVNDELIFRFPRYPAEAANLITEVRLLEFIRGYVSLPVPKPVYTNLTATTAGKIFMGYRMIPGEPLWREKLASITDQAILQRLAGQLASFLKELHSIPVESVPIDLPVQDGPDEWARLYGDLRQDLFGFMRPEAQARVRSHFESYLHNPRYHHYRACLRHGDFGGGNILYDPQALAIRGIIDFGGLGLGDPAVDVAAASCYGEAFLERILAVYPEATRMLERARFYQGTYALQEALHGFQHNDRAAFESGMAEVVDLTAGTYRPAFRVRGDT